MRAIDQFGFGSLGLQAADFNEPDQVVQLGHPPIRIDLMTSILGVEFGSCHSSRVRTSVDGVAVDFIDLENLKRNKRATGRAQDLADVENLQ